MAASGYHVNYITFEISDFAKYVRYDTFDMAALGYHVNYDTFEIPDCASLRIPRELRHF